MSKSQTKVIGSVIALIAIVLLFAFFLKGKAQLSGSNYERASIIERTKAPAHNDDESGHLAAIDKANTEDKTELKLGNKQVVLLSDQLKIRDGSTELFSESFPECKELSIVSRENNPAAEEQGLVIDAESGNGEHTLHIYRLIGNEFIELEELNTQEIKFAELKGKSKSSAKRQTFTSLTGEKIFEDWGQFGVTANIQLTFDNGNYEIMRFAISGTKLKDFLRSGAMDGFKPNEKATTAAELAPPELADFLLQLICYRQEPQADRILNRCWKGSEKEKKQYWEFLISKRPRMIKLEPRFAEGADTRVQCYVLSFRDDCSK